jgi:hypothetical protein
MKKLLNSILFLALMAFVITSCSKSDNPIIPDPTPSTDDHPVLWSYDLGNGGMADIIPAIDENDNIYFSMVKEDGFGVLVFALDKNGNELWKTEVAGTSTEKVTYSGGKVFVATENPIGIHCIQGSSGSILWSKDYTAEYDFEWMLQVAVNNNKVYLSTGQFFYGFLLALDFDGNELWIKQGPTMGAAYSLSAFGNELYFSDGEYLFRYDDNGTSCDSVWAYTLLEGKSTVAKKGYFDAFNVVFGTDDNIYLRNDTKIEIVSRTGQLVNEINLGDDFYNSYSGIILTSDNSIVIGNGNLVKYSHAGIMEWETDIHDGWLVNPTFQTTPVLSSNGDFYDAQLFGLYSVKGNGNLNWKENAETEAGIEYGNLHPPVLTHEGNIISISSEQSVVRCFKGDGHGLATSGWPKVYGDYGNTCSK